MTRDLPRHSPRGRTAPLLTTLLVLVTLLPLTGCTSPFSDPVAQSSTSAGGERHDPSQAEIDSLVKQLREIDGVYTIESFAYQKGTFGNGPETRITFESKATTQPALVKILDNAYRLTWFRSDIAMGTLIYIVKNPSTGAEAGSSDFGYKTASIGPQELLERYGPAPATPPTPSPS